MKPLSVLNNAFPGSITYYTGNNPMHCQHLNDCDLICHIGFDPHLPGVNLIQVEDPQLYFYQLSKQYAEDYVDQKNLEEINGSYIHRDAKIHPSVEIHPRCTIGRVTIDEGCTIHSGCIIYSKTLIRKNTYIEANTVIGAAGMMWVWNGNERVFLEQLGSVVIGQNCKIGSNITIVRGSANEITEIGNDVCMAHGTKIGHGCKIGDQVHFANNVSVGGSVLVATNSFLGCGSTVSPRVNINESIILGAGSCLVKSTNVSGVYVGVPAIYKKAIQNSHSGVPKKIT